MHAGARGLHDGETMRLLSNAIFLSLGLSLTSLACAAPSGDDAESSEANATAADADATFDEALALLKANRNAANESACVAAHASPQEIFAKIDIAKSRAKQSGSWPALRTRMRDAGRTNEELARSLVFQEIVETFDGSLDSFYALLKDQWIEFFGVESNTVYGLFADPHQQFLRGVFIRLNGEELSGWGSIKKVEGKIRLEGTIGNNTWFTLNRLENNGTFSYRFIDKRTDERRAPWEANPTAPPFDATWKGCKRPALVDNANFRTDLNTPPSFGGGGGEGFGGI